MFRVKTDLSGEISYTCFGCGEEIPAGSPSLKLSHKTNGNEESVRLCPRCGFFASIKSRSPGTIQEGEFIERLLPNCLRREWKRYLEHPDQYPFQSQHVAKRSDVLRVEVSKDNFWRIERGAKFAFFDLPSDRNLPVPGERIEIRSSGCGKRRCVGHVEKSAMIESADGLALLHRTSPYCAIYFTQIGRGYNEN